MAFGRDNFGLNPNTPMNEADRNLNFLYRNLGKCVRVVYEADTFEGTLSQPSGKNLRTTPGTFYIGDSPISSLGIISTTRLGEGVA